MVSLFDTLMYGLSIPERTARSAAAVAGGLVGETATRLIPLSFRSSKSYRTFVQQSLDMLTHDVGAVARPAGTPTTDGAESSDETTPATVAETSLARKAVGSVLDVAGTATFHLSPMTVLAVVNDLAYGSNAYLKELAEELKREGVIDDTSTVHHVSDLLDVLGRTSDRVGTGWENPPVDVEGFRQTVSEISREIERADPASVLPSGEMQRLWDDLHDIAAASSLGVFQVGSAVTMHAMNRLDLARRGTLSTVRVTGGLLDQHVFDHYRTAITDIRRDGLFETIQTASGPYVDAVWDHFAAERETWTADLLSGRMLRRWWVGDGEESSP